MPPRPNGRLPDSGPDRDDGTMAATTAGPWVGRSIQRVEDDALLRGEGRFLDDLAPVAHSFHAAIVRSQLAHARIEVDAAAALTLPGVVGVLTGADVAALSRPFPAGIESGTPQYAAAIDTVRYVGEPIAVVVAQRPVSRRGRSGARRGGLRPAGAGARSGVGRSGQRRPRPPVRVRGRRRRDGGGRPRPATDVPVSTFHLHSGRMLRRRRRLGRGGRPPDGMGELPGPVHAARRRRSRARIEGRPAAPAHATRLGRLVRDQVGRLLLRRADRARLAPPRGTGDVDRGPARAPRRERGRNGPDDGGRGGLHVRRPADRASLRRDRGRRGIRPRAGARHALPHARLPLRRLPRLATWPCATESF